jgi:hypothetical protein
MLLVADWPPQGTRVRNPTLISPLPPSTPPQFYNLSTTALLAVSRPRTPGLRSHRYVALRMQIPGLMR